MAQRGFGSIGASSQRISRSIETIADGAFTAARLILESRATRIVDPGDWNAERADSRGPVRQLSGGVRFGKCLFLRRRLLRANDARADLPATSRVDRASPRIRKFSDGNNAAHDCSIGLSDHRVVDLAQTV